MKWIFMTENPATSRWDTIMMYCGFELTPINCLIPRASIHPQYAVMASFIFDLA